MDAYTKRLFRRKLPTLIVTALIVLTGWLLELLGT